MSQPLMVLSYSGLCKALACEAITESALEAALFYPNCTRNHAMQPGSDPYVASVDVDEVHLMYRNQPDSLSKARLLKETVLRVLSSAELELRVIWPRKAGDQDVYHFNSLLEFRGFSPVNTD